MGIRLSMEAITEPFALSACLAVNKIEPLRAQSTQRALRKVEQVIFTKIFAFPAGFAVN